MTEEDRYFNNIIIGLYFGFFCFSGLIAWNTHHPLLGLCIGMPMGYIVGVIRHKMGYGGDND